MTPRTRALLIAAQTALAAASIPAAAAIAPVDPNAPAPAAHPMRDRFQAANTTHDGHLTLDQAKAGHLALVVQHFGDIDQQHRGYVTMVDIHAYQKQRHAAREAAAASTPASTTTPGDTQ